MKKTLQKLKPLGKRIFLIKDKLEKTASGILLLQKEGNNAPPYTGTIIAVGPDVEDKDYTEGVRVLFHDFAGFEIEHEGDKIYSIRDHDVAAIIEKNIQIS